MAGFFGAQINTSFGMRQARHDLLSLLGFGMLLGLTACVQLPEVQEKKDKPVLVYPLPPDEARFIYERTITNNLDVDTTKPQESSTLRNILTGENSLAAGFEHPAKWPEQFGRFGEHATSVRVTTESLARLLSGA